MITENAVWFITGCSRGLGRALAEQALAAGDRVVVTARRAADAAAVVAGHEDRALALALDVTDRAQIDAAVAAATGRFGGIDVLVNNAGYGYFAAIEEGEEAGVRDLFDTNVFGPVALIKAVLPGMRARGRGHVVNISSIGGYVTFPAAGYYHMTKFALEALSETLAKEVAGFGIGVTVVAPGAFRTDFRAGGAAKQPATRLAAYAETAGAARDRFFAGHGTQIGDPVRAAQAIITAVRAPEPPVHLLLGRDALGMARQKLDELRSGFDAWEALTTGTDLADASS